MAIEAAHGAVRVPAGYVAETQRGQEPGIPFADDAPEEIRRQAQQLVDLGALLAAARREDGFTLWHLWQRLPEPQRGQVLVRLRELFPIVPENPDPERTWSTLVKHFFE